MTPTELLAILVFVGLPLAFVAYNVYEMWTMAPGDSGWSDFRDAMQVDHHDDWHRRF